MFRDFRPRQVSGFRVVQQVEGFFDGGLIEMNSTSNEFQLPIYYNINH